MNIYYQNLRYISNIWYGRITDNIYRSICVNIVCDVDGLVTIVLFCSV